LPYLNFIRGYEKRTHLFIIWVIKKNWKI